MDELFELSFLLLSDGGELRVFEFDEGSANLILLDACSDLLFFALLQFVEEVVKHILVFLLLQTNLLSFFLEFV